MENPYVRPWYRRLFMAGVEAGRNPKLTRANCPECTSYDRRPWLRGFDEGRRQVREVRVQVVI